MAKLTDKEVRERIVSRGAAALTDSELLSVVVAAGDTGQQPLALAEAVLDGTTLAALARLPLRDLRMAGGMGIKRAAALAAAFELGRRVRGEEAAGIETVDSSEDVRRIFQPALSALDHEEFWVLYLNSAHRILEKTRISQGGVNGTVVDHKLIVKRAVELLAAAIVIVHNHPSGVASPSREDVEITERVTTAASLFDIQLLDHLIVAREKTFSFRSEGLIK